MEILFPRCELTHLYELMRADRLPDFIPPLRVVRQGQRVKCCPEVVSREVTLGQKHYGYRKRIWVSLRALLRFCWLQELPYLRHGLLFLRLLARLPLRHLLVVPRTGARSFRAGPASSPTRAV